MVATEVLFLHPGELYAGRRPLILKTILGSCVAVTFWHMGNGMTAMCHFVLPRRPHTSEPAMPRDCDGRYGDDALQFLGMAARASDANPCRFKVGVFGGASISQGRVRAQRIGSSNIELALQALDALGYTVDVLDVAGHGSRVLQLDSRDGSVLIKYHSLVDEDSGRIVRGGEAWASRS